MWTDDKSTVQVERFKENLATIEAGCDSEVGGAIVDALLYLLGQTRDALTLGQDADGPRPINIGDLKLTGEMSGQFVRKSDGASVEARFRFVNGVVTVAEFGERLSDEKLQEALERAGDAGLDLEANGFAVSLQPAN